MLKLNDLLRLSKEDLENTRVRFNTDTPDGKSPIEIYKQTPQKLLEWVYYNNKQYEVGQISIGLVNMKHDRWLLVTIGRITKLLDAPVNSKDGKGGVQVEYDTLTEYADLFGRTIISFHNNSQQLFRCPLNKDKQGVMLIDKLEIREILPSMFTGFDFPGYDKVSLSYDELSTIVNGNYPSYKNALENQKAVYLQTDKATGKLYVGSATAKEGMLLARWSTYVKNGHGGNKGLKKLIDEKGFDYIKENFQYTIIENFNSKVDDHYVLEREAYWKEVFQSKTHGYNEN